MDPIQIVNFHVNRIGREVTFARYKQRECYNFRIVCFAIDSDHIDANLQTFAK